MMKFFCVMILIGFVYGAPADVKEETKPAAIEETNVEADKTAEEALTPAESGHVSHGWGWDYPSYASSYDWVPSHHVVSTHHYVPKTVVHHSVWPVVSHHGYHDSWNAWPSSYSSGWGHGWTGSAWHGW